MDRVRLGRALGYGTRHAAKTLVAVAEAAAAQKTPGPDTRPERAYAARVDRALGEASQTPSRRLPTAAQVRGAGRSMWGPLATFSGALWLRVTGLFFGLIAFAMGNGAWRSRAAFHVGGAAAAHFWIFVAFALLFGYFAVSGFARASLRERRAAGDR